MLTNYLDVDELAVMLRLCIATVRKILRARPWELPTRAHGFGELMRWRRYEVARWMLDVESAI